MVHLQKDYISKFKRNIGISSVRKIVQGCGLVVDFLIGHAKESNIKSPIPKENVFHDISFYNTRNMEKRTEIIPDNVADEIYSKLQQLNPLHQLMYKIFMDTGLRLKEVTFLEADCISPTEYDNIKYLKYIPFKTLASRRKRSLTDHRKMLIPQYLADEIQDQIVRSNSLRDKYNTPYIFINQMRGHRAAVSQGNAFVNAVNRLIKEHNIIDADGQLWKFSSRQFRKTLVSVMIENGATTDEIAYWLGHLKKRTAREYYEDIRKIQLADLNADYFRKTFDVLMSNQQFDKFSEAEKKALYIDFRLNYRAVELGHCMKHFTEEPCSYLTGKTHCATCANLCTGPQYLKEWIRLKDSQKIIVDGLLDLYKKENITDYRDFKEYQAEMYLLSIYEDVINNIKSKIVQTSCREGAGV